MTGYDSFSSVIFYFSLLIGIRHQDGGITISFCVVISGGVQLNLMDSFYKFYDASNYQKFHIDLMNHICPLCEDCDKQCSYVMKGFDIYLVIHNFPFC